MTQYHKHIPKFVFTAVIFSILVGGNVSGQTEPMFFSARKFLKLLHPDQIRSATMPFETEERYNWHFIPRSRKGISFVQLSDEDQVAAAYKLLGSGLSKSGFEKAAGIIELEGILGEIETLGFMRRNPEKYYFSIFGQLEEIGNWGWRVEGHHLSLNFTLVEGKPVSQTPVFWGANPAEVPHGSKKGWKVLKKEEELARDLILSLDSKQKALAIISEKAPRDITTGTSRKAATVVSEGIPWSALKKNQQELLLSLITVYTDNFRDDLAEGHKEKIRRAGTQNLKFAWAGGLHPGQGHYYRIEGPTHLIEYDNTQNGANHIHSVFRELDNDFGEDLLGNHYEEAHNGH